MPGFLNPKAKGEAAASATGVRKHSFEDFLKRNLFFLAFQT